MRDASVVCIWEHRNKLIVLHSLTILTEHDSISVHPDHEDLNYQFPDMSSAIEFIVTTCMMNDYQIPFYTHFNGRIYNIIFFKLDELIRGIYKPGKYVCYDIE